MSCKCIPCHAPPPCVHMHASHHTCECVIVTHVNGPCHTCEWTVPHVWMRHRHTYGRVTWHISMRHCDASEWVTCECIVVMSESRKSLVGVNEYECAKCWVMQQSSPALYPSSTPTSVIYTYIRHLHLHPHITNPISLPNTTNATNHLNLTDSLTRSHTALHTTRVAYIQLESLAYNSPLHTTRLHAPLHTTHAPLHTTRLVSLHTAILYTSSTHDTLTQSHQHMTNSLSLINTWQIHSVSSTHDTLTQSPQHTTHSPSLSNSINATNHRNITNLLSRLRRVQQASITTDATAYRYSRRVMYTWQPQPVLQRAHAAMRHWKMTKSLSHSCVTRLIPLYTRILYASSTHY